MIKFRCLRCSQKIAVNNDGCGVVITCTTCNELLIVPPRSDEEFAGVEREPVVIPTVVEPPSRAALMPQLARLLMSRLVQGLLSQRTELMQAQEAAANQIQVMEQRMALLQTKLQRRLRYYEEHITSLQQELRAKELENQHLRLRIRQPAQYGNLVPMGTANGTPSRVRLRATVSAL